MIRYRLSLPSCIGHSLLLRRCIASVSSIEGYSEAFASELALTVHEAFINAVRHGNRQSPSLSVVVQFESRRTGEERCLEVRIRDCGRGFDPGPFVSRPLSPEGQLSTGGRGLFLIHHFTESIRIERTGGGCELVLRYIPY